ncbi:isopentenyl phosphate kinase [Thermofilum pendens]|uniref:Isopentenyl phosphate kinase n=1 Tax=Thermofilum pendens (strain DSM 2475 / Hrk 5) TaxID=368408 RepID=A1RXT2_THEPD|nr:isopentenyl phosphate kinase [Thermofilum pendens]ABL78012.1 aspartate/glutamate/uridylate kinase [Thermofilum pendens Hrk 5]
MNPAMLTVIKLGGSVITDKSKPYTVRSSNLKTASAALAKLYGEGYDIVLVHGGGSFGHPTAAKYRLHEGGLSPEKVRGFSETRYWMTKLNTLVVEHLLRLNVPAVSLQTSAIAVNSGGKLSRISLDVLREMLARRLVPVLYGDAVIDLSRGFSILSGDTLAARIAVELGAKSLVYVMGAGGVYSKPPGSPDARLLREIAENDVLTVGGTHGVDVTGGLREKLAEAFYAAKNGVRVCIGGVNFIEKMVKGEEAPYTVVKA